MTSSTVTVSTESHDICDASIAQMIKREKKLRTQLLHASSVSPAARNRVLQRYLHSHAVKVVVAMRVNADLPADHRVSQKRMLKEVCRVNWRKRLRESATLFWKQKSSGGYRCIWNPGFRRRLSAALFLPVLDGLIRPQRFQYDYKGLEALIQDIRSAVQAGGLYFQCLDIKDHFGSFEREKLLHWLPLPKKVVAHLVLSRSIPVRTKGGTLPYECMTTARRGIPQGSALSARVALLSTSRLAWKPRQGVWLFGYADNFGVIGTSRRRVDKAAEALDVAVAALPGGTFTIKHDKTTNLRDDAVEFLGFEISVVKRVAHIAPSSANLLRLPARLLAQDQIAMGAFLPGFYRKPIATKNVRQALARAWHCSVSWDATFKCCDTYDRWSPAVYVVLQSYAHRLRVSMEEIVSYPCGRVKWDWGGYKSE